MSLKVYGYPNTRSVRVVWMLEELALDYDYQLVDFMKGESKASGFLELNPAGKVPVLQVDGTYLTESAAIINYLHSLRPDAGLIPEGGALRRAVYDQWCFFALTELEQPLWTMAKHKFAIPKEKRCPDVIATAEWEFQQALKLLSEGLGERDYILGKEFSAADILIAHSLFWGMACKQPIEQENLKAYIGRCGIRPALAAARAKEQAAGSA